VSLHVLDAGLYTLPVDLGRPTTRSLGVPVGGAADRSALMLGNALVGNPPDAVALEITLKGPTVRTDHALGCVVFGAPFTRSCGQRTVRANATFTLEAGDVLRIGGTPKGARAYLCVTGGFELPPVLCSWSALAPLRAGDELACGTGRLPVRFLETEPLAGTDGVLRVLPGAQADWFDTREFHGQEYMVTPASNRMGLRLEGRPLRLPERELVSEPVCPGAVQVTRDGQCIVLGVDGQTIGGYPKVGQVISADLDRLGQLRPGDKVRFSKVSLAEAEAAYREHQSELRRWLTRLHIVSGSD
jgi:antagonist of KipI